MSSERFLIYGAVYLALLRNNQIFLLCRANTGYKDGFWCMPSGHIEKDENPEESAIREAKEEAGVDVYVENIEFAYSLFKRGQGGRERTYADYMFITRAWENDALNAEPEKASEGKWFDINQLPENMIEGQKEMLINYLNGKHYSTIIEQEV